MFGNDLSTQSLMAADIAIEEEQEIQLRREQEAAAVLTHPRSSAPKSAPRPATSTPTPAAAGSPSNNNGHHHAQRNRTPPPDAQYRSGPLHSSPRNHDHIRDHHVDGDHSSSAGMERRGSRSMNTGNDEAHHHEREGRNYTSSSEHHHMHDKTHHHEREGRNYTSSSEHHHMHDDAAMRASSPPGWDGWAHHRRRSARGDEEMAGDRHDSNDHDHVDCPPSVPHQEGHDARSHDRTHSAPRSPYVAFSTSPPNTPPPGAGLYHGHTHHEDHGDNACEMSGSVNHSHLDDDAHHHGHRHGHGGGRRSSHGDGSHHVREHHPPGSPSHPSHNNGRRLSANSSPAAMMAHMSRSGSLSGSPTQHHVPGNAHGTQFGGEITDGPQTGSPPQTSSPGHGHVAVARTQSPPHDQPLLSRSNSGDLEVPFLHIHVNTHIKPDDPAEISFTTLSDSDLQSHPEDPEHPHAAVRHIVFCVIPIFMGYAILLSMQERLREHLGITDSKSPAAYTFGVAVSLLFVGNLVFRLCHGIVFSFLRPRNRVLVAYGGMMFAAVSLLIPYFGFPAFKNLAFVFIAYIVAGCAIGTFESNIVSCTTPLGHATKVWVLIGMPLGYNGTAISAFLLLWFTNPDNGTRDAALYALLFISNGLGAILFYFGIPDVPFEASEDTARKLWHDLRLWREWVPRMWQHLVAMFVNMWCVILMSGVVLYIYKVDNVPLIRPSFVDKASWGSIPTLEKNLFLCLYNLCAFLGDFSARKVAYWGWTPRWNPLVFIIFSVVSIGTCWLKIAPLSWIGMFVVMFVNGTIYATTTRHVDDHIPRRFNLTALSAWLFLGDVGSEIASLVTDPLSVLVGKITAV